jgi:hypothetical protein
MSFQAMAWAIKQKAGDPACRLLLLVLSNYADEDYRAWPSQKTLMADTGMSERTVRDKTNWLVEHGLLTVETTKHAYGKKLTYTLNPPAEFAGPHRQDTVYPPAGSAAPHRQNLQNPPAKSAANTINKPITKDSIVGFERFWLACPRRVGKEAAKKAYEKARKLVSDDELFEGIRRYATSRLGQDEQFTVHPATWLNQGRWADEPAGGSQQGSGAKRELTEEEKWEAARRFHEFWETKEKMGAKNG